MYRLRVIVFVGRGALHLFANWNPSGPNLLDEPLKDFIVTPACSPWKCFEIYKPGYMGITTHSKSVQPLQSIKLVYQPCSRSQAALEPLWNRWSLYIIHVYVDHVFILGLWQLVATHMLKLWQLKAKCNQIRVKLLSLMNSMLYLLSTTCTYACFTFQYFGKSRMGTRLLVWRS